MNLSTKRFSLFAVLLAAEIFVSFSSPVQFSPLNHVDDGKGDTEMSMMTREDNSMQKQQKTGDKDWIRDYYQKNF
jgi:hypothetical protein